MDNNLIYILIIGALVGASSGYLGSFMVLKRMSLVGDALSHMALPGIAIALLIGINPMLGALMALFIATIGIWFIGNKTDLNTESLVGIFFTASLSLGLLLTPEPELLEALFGDIDKITKFDGILTILGAILIFSVTYLISKKLILGIVSEDLVKSQKINYSLINLIYLSLVSLVVAMGIKFLGTLLTGAMVIIPAVSARNFSRSIKSYQIFSILIGVLSSVFGILIARQFDFSTGPIIVLSSVAFFIISFIFKLLK